MQAPRQETYLAFSALTALSLLLPACCGDGEDDSAAVVAPDEWTPELLVEDRAAYICDNFFVEAQSETGPMTQASCLVDSQSFMYKYMPQEGFFYPELADACVKASAEQSTYEFWVWCFSSWVP